MTRQTFEKGSHFELVDSHGARLKLSEPEYQVKKGEKTWRDR
jgi:hypothetical protein